MYGIISRVDEIKVKIKSKKAEGGFGKCRRTP